MANKLATRYNFNGYTYIDEMIGDGILRCVEAFKSFDPTRSNPFSYFTVILYRTFVQRIKKEKQTRKARDELIMINDIYSIQEGDDTHLTKDQIIGDYTFSTSE
jgi:DNA-directed RNA polymerase specialized sigma24 family protein